MTAEFPEETAEGRREGKRRKGCRDAGNASSETKQKPAVEDKETQERWTGLLEKGGLISSF